jgi:hypothetical protein
MVSFVNVQCSETRSLAANKSLRVSILLAAAGNTMEGRLIFPSAFNKHDTGVRKVTSITLHPVPQDFFERQNRLLNSSLVGVAFGK